MLKNSPETQKSRLKHTFDIGCNRRVGKASALPKKKQDLRHCRVAEPRHYWATFKFSRHCGLDPQSHSLHVIKKVAFTLAEVLITLGIIGVVAAMTLPTVIAKYEKKQTAVRLKQTYTQLQEAIALSVVENGDIKEWNWPQENWFDTYIVKYLKLAKNKGEFKVFDSENQDEIDAGDYIPYKQISGQQETGLALLRKGFSGSSSYVLANGVELVTYNNSSSGGADIFVDLNTSSRKPNQFGKDAFIFTIFKDYGPQLFGMKPTTECPFEGSRDRDHLMSDSCFSYKCSKDGRGMWCGALIMVDGWEIKDDYPW